MPRTPAIPPSDRFFARLEGAMLECPRCGTLDYFSQRGAAGKSAEDLRIKRLARYKRLSKPSWNPSTGRWKCPSCHLTCILGILAWPTTTAPHQTRPRDQVPNQRQLLQLRNEGGGRWMREALTGYRAKGSNLTAGCRCAPGCAYTDQREPTCPIHGEGAGEDEPEAAEEGAEGEPE